jgi:hypothetical protein
MGEWRMIDLKEKTCMLRLFPEDTRRGLTLIVGADEIGLLEKLGYMSIREAADYVRQHHKKSSEAEVASQALSKVWTGNRGLVKFKIGPAVYGYTGISGRVTEDFTTTPITEVHFEELTNPGTGQPYRRCDMRAFTVSDDELGGLELCTGYRR